MIGETGSGKTCLINAILNNLDLLNFQKPNVEYYNFSPVISYACQDPWIMNGTIRDNIIFYGEYDIEKYNQVINACQLDKDFENLKHGDLTEIGSTGNNISGGQRSRISLARAIYKDADIYLFDDPIPSVDSFVSIKIFHQAIVNFLKNKTRIFVNPTGRFVKGGPMADSGLTGRKIIVDTYGGWVPHGGGAFSGKDPTKVDRSGAYMTRYAAKNIVASGIADECQIQVAYAIGVAEPVSLNVNTFGTGKISDEKISELLREFFDFRPAAIIRDLDLRKPQYKALASYGHMGRIDLPILPGWEKTDRAEELKRAAGI